LAQAKATHRVLFVCQIFVKLMCSYGESVRTKELFQELFSYPTQRLFRLVARHFFGTRNFLGTGEHPRAYLLFKGDFMNKRDQKLLDKQLWGGSSNPPHRGIIIGFIAVFLVGIGVGDILSKTKQANTPQANTHYAAMNSFPNGKE
jgi:hypothetical protein